MKKITKRILVIDDDQLMLTVLSENIRGIGCDVDEAFCRSEALRLLSERNYDLMITDLHMPECSGLDLVKYVRDPSSEVENHDLTIAVLTGSVVDDEQQWLKTHNVDHLLSKPISSKDIQQLIFSETCERQIKPADLSKDKPQDRPPSAFIDRERTIKLCGGSSEIAHKVCSLITEQTPDIINYIEERSIKNDFAGIVEKAHFYKGGLSVLTQGTPFKLISELVEAAKAKDPGRTHTKLQEFKDIMPALHHEIQTFLQTMSTAQPNQTKEKNDINILIAEDNQATSEALKSFLENQGYDVTSVNDGTSAWEILNRDHAPRIAILDWDMPGMSGLDISLKLRETQTEDYTYIILLTGRETKADQVAGYQAGVDDYLIKPFDTDEVAARLHAGKRIIDLKQKLIAAGKQRENETKKHNQELMELQKLTAIGQLAAGIAHEINTPSQYVSDNIYFLDESFDELKGAVDQLRELYQSATATPETMKQSVDTILEECDFEFLNEEIPLAIQQAKDGISKIARIVKAMKQFSHPGSEEKTLTDINAALETTITVCRNEWKSNAILQTHFENVQLWAACLPGELNQVFLNIIVNAAQAIRDKYRDQPEKKGTILVKTKQHDNNAIITIEDDGPGIAEDHLTKIFDPFFTTKAVGQGTGQGLAISYNIIKKKHSGNLRVQTEAGKGTMFIIELPMEPEAPLNSNK